MEKVNKEKTDGYVLLGPPDRVLYGIKCDQSDLEMARTNLVALAADVQRQQLGTFMGECFKEDLVRSACMPSPARETIIVFEM